jgi:hypothetical protein
MKPKLHVQKNNQNRQIMKKQHRLIAVFILLCGVMSGQHLIRVNNNPGTDADYATLQAANEAASNGDTIYIESSTSNYAGAEFSKKLVIVGPGYFLSDNDSTQAFAMEAEITGYTYFKAGSAGSTITGCNVNALSIEVSDIVITRCKIGSIGFGSNVNNTLITQNYLGYIGGSSNVTNTIISNNIITSYVISFSNNTGPTQITNNVFTTSNQTFSVNNSSIANNIFCHTTNPIGTGTGNTITNNLFACPGTNANGNQYNVVMANVFVDFSGSLNYSDDAKWKLKTGSPAIGAGVSGVDCGAFGGTIPYVLSGIPKLPHIYEASIPGTAYSDKGLACTIKVKSGK